jgi:hypothetical protein
MIEDARATKDVESNTKPLRKTYWSYHFEVAYVHSQIMKIGGNETAVADYDHLAAPLFPINTDASSIIHTHDAKRRSRVNKYPEFVPLNKDGNDGHKVAFV